MNIAMLASSTLAAMVLTSFSHVALAKPVIVEVSLRNPASSPSGLPADLIDVVGTVTCRSNIFTVSKENFDFAREVARLEVADGEYCTVLITSMMLKVRGTGQLVTYAASDRPFEIALSNSVSAQKNSAAEDSAVSFSIDRPGPTLPGQLWFAAQVSQGRKAVVGIDLSRDLVIKNVKNFL